MDCLFCKIVKGEVESKKIYEDEQVMAILDAYPNVNGHTLIIPKKHYEDFLAMPEELVGHIHEVAKKISPILIKEMDAECFSLRVNYGTTQAIKHFHLHLLPNYDGQKRPLMDKDKVYEAIKKAM